MVCPRQAATPLELSPSMAAAASPVRRQGSPREYQSCRDSLDHNSRAFEIKAKPDLFQSGLTHCMAELRLVVRIEHKKSASARAYELSAERAINHCQIIPLIDLRIGHAPAALLLPLPMHIHQPRKLVQVASLQCPPA